MRKLRLHRETLRDLDSTSIRMAAGGLSLNGCWTPVVWTLPLDQCVHVQVTGLCPSQGCTPVIASQNGC